ncbi:hypothetical protein FRX31_010838 [Thalictrum thalictroides]|uniref:Uncharacterized protein n=1 Tax=Thalictrum thalictroides TaxID=46969 RepID=A0A7J6WSY0_THATH|nr:hypothetical protein FRX31_010838 [Thalictrum thalictroides]
MTEITRNQKIEANQKNLETRMDDMTSKQSALSDDVGVIRGDVDEIKISMKNMTDRFDLISQGLESILGIKMDVGKVNTAEDSSQLRPTSSTSQGSIVGQGSVASHGSILGAPPTLPARLGEGNNGSPSQFHVPNQMPSNSYNRRPDNSYPTNGFVNTYGNFKVPKIDFPRFNGEDVRGWIMKAARYFLFNPIDKSQMVLFASLHLEGRADTWF